MNRNRYVLIMKKLIKYLLLSFLGVILCLTCFAGKPSGGASNHGGFTFSYSMGYVTNYHAYGVAALVWNGNILYPQPPGTVIVGRWYMWDLGRALGNGTVTCPAPLYPTGKSQSDLGLLFFVADDDVGGDGREAIWTHPVGDVQIFKSTWYNGYASVVIINPDNTGNTLYWGPPPATFYWDFIGYLN
jgi:hypothetical protein